MILPVNKTCVLSVAFMLLISFSGPVRPAAMASAADAPFIQADINHAQIAGQKLLKQVLASGTAFASSSELVVMPMQTEIPAIDNLINTAASAVTPIIASLTSVASVASDALQVTAVASSASDTLLPANQPANGYGETATNSEFIDTLFPDPLSPDFPTSSTIDRSEKDKPITEIIEEINIRAEEIADKTAAQMGSTSIEITRPIKSAISNTNTADEKPGLETLPDETTEDIKQSATSPAEIQEKDKPEGQQTDPKDQQPDLQADLQKIEQQDLQENLKKDLKEPDLEKVTKIPEVGSISSPLETVSESEIEETPAPEEESAPVKKPSTETVTVYSENVASESENLAASMTREIIPVSWPASEEDPEFASPSVKLAGSDADASEEAPVKLFEKTAALDPVLMTRGAPEDELSDINKIQKLSGQIVPEKKRLGRRKNLFRWVLKTDDGKRIPLKSNLKLLTEVRREKLLDGPVNLSGHFVPSGINTDLRFFVVESATSASSENASASAEVSGEPAAASSSSELNK